MKTKETEPMKSDTAAGSNKGDIVRVVAVRENGIPLDEILRGAPTNVTDTRERSVIVAGDDGTVSAGYRGSAIAGFGSAATAGLESEPMKNGEGLAYVLGGSATCRGKSGIAITRSGGTAQAADLLAASFQEGHAIMEGGGIAIAINRPDAHPDSLFASAQASTGGLIILGYTVPAHVVYVVRKVDGVNIKANTAYRLDANYQPVEA